MEVGTDEEIYERPTHPYTQALLSAVPVPDPSLRGSGGPDQAGGRRAVAGRPAVRLPLPHPVLAGPAVCSEDEPELIERADLNGTHPSACHFVEESMMTSTRTHTE